MKILTLLVGLLLFLGLGYFYYNHSLNPHFVDEEDNFVLGKYLSEGDKLYSNLFSHHQPLSYIFSAGIQKITQPESLFLLVSRHREVIIIWSFLWSIFFIFRFGWPLVIFSFIFELTKINLFGNLFLSESIVVYPLIFILLPLFFNQKEINFWEWLILGLSFGMAFLLLSPLWPVLFFLGGCYWFKYGLKKKPRQIILLTTGLLFPVLLILPFISLKDYWHNAFYINFHYYIPITSGEFLPLTLLKAFSSPVIALLNFSSSTQTTNIIRFSSLILLVGWFVLLKKKSWKYFLLTFIALGLTNFRFIVPGSQEYDGFHLLPWYAVLILLSIIFLWKLKASFRGLLSLSLLVFSSFMLMFLALQSAQSNLFQKRNMQKDYYVNYSRQFDFGEAVKIIKSPGESLIVVPDDWLIYWQADIKHAHKMVNYYAWMSKVPEIKNSLDLSFKNNPPTYFYCDCKGSYFGLENYFYLYKNLERDGQTTDLMVLSDKLKELSPEQKNKLEFFRFKVN